jgi:hypothetical protein
MVTSTSLRRRLWSARAFASLAASLDPRGLLVTVEIDEQLIERDGWLESIVRRPIGPEAIIALEFVEPIFHERLAARPAC